MSKKTQKTKENSPLQNKSVFLLVGMPGSGKSTFAKKIANKFNINYLSSDDIREELFNSIRHDLAGDDATNKLRKKAQKVLYRRALKFLSKNEKIIIDATHLELKTRNLAIKTLSAVADKTQMCFIVVSTPDEIIEQRIKEKVDELANEIETAYEGWKRVTSYFLRDFKNGKRTWPTKTESIDLFDHTELAYDLAEKN